MKQRLGCILLFTINLYGATFFAYIAYDTMINDIRQADRLDPVEFHAWIGRPLAGDQPYFVKRTDGFTKLEVWFDFDTFIKEGSAHERGN